VRDISNLPNFCTISANKAVYTLRLRKNDTDVAHYIFNAH